MQGKVGGLGTGNRVCVCVPMVGPMKGGVPEDLRGLYILPSCGCLAKTSNGV